MAVKNALRRVANALAAEESYLTELDQAMGDGDLGITAAKIAAALKMHVTDAEEADPGKYLAGAGMAVGRAASSSFGTLLATALMRAGKEVRGKDELTRHDLARMLEAADAGIQERGKAKPGDKTVIDAVHPAAQAFSRAVAEDESLETAAERMLKAAEGGRDAVRPLRSKVGRSSWVGERTEGKVDPGCAAAVIILKALLDRR